MIAVFGHIFFYLALSIANAALVSSAKGIQYVMIFVLATIVAIWKPKLLQEDLSKKEIIKKIIGIVLIVVAIYVLNT